MAAGCDVGHTSADKAAADDTDRRRATGGASGHAARLPGNRTVDLGAPPRERAGRGAPAPSPFPLPRQSWAGVPMKSRLPSSMPQWRRMS
jgi:hypothetical protein